ncbi:MAG: DUF5018 domain-containing protein [Treponema sp.]|nr:DUF5018 domain-containing protein [Treponema sp.]
MKKVFFILAAVSLASACSNPVLKWIDTPTGKTTSLGGDGRVAGPADSKEIVSFTFGLEGEKDFVSNTPGSGGIYPILVLLSGGTSRAGLSPSITFRGKSLDPPSGAAGNFSASVSSPVIYTVSAEDGSQRKYGVTVYVPDNTSREIIRFAVDVSGLTAEGLINQEAGTIAVSVPAGTNTGFLSAQVVHTGIFFEDPLGGRHPEETFTFTGDFSAPRQLKVVARNLISEKIYTVTVTREKSHDKEITVFSLNSISGQDVIIGGAPRPDGKYPILVLVPGDPVLSGLAPFISYTGASVSPGPETALDFGRPETYTVTAEDRSTRDYVVTVIKKGNDDATARITGFYFKTPLVEGLIDETAKTIALTVPFGTALNALVPEIYYTGSSVSPLDGQPKDFTGSDSPGAGVEYTVRSRDGTKTEKYKVHVFTAPAPSAPGIDVPGVPGETVKTGTGGDGKYTVIVELPVFINNPTVNINYQGGGSTVITPGTVINNNNTVIWTGDTNEYNVIVISPPENPPGPPNSSGASIDAFYFSSPAAIGEIGATDGSDGAGTDTDPYAIRVKVPYGTNLQNLTATVCYTGREIAGIPGSNPLADGPRSFLNPLVYTVVAANDTETVPNRKYYQVTVEAVKSGARAITAFAFNGVAETSAVISAMPNAGGEYPILITVPDTTILDSLTPVITHTGKEIVPLSNGGNTLSPPSPEFPKTVEESAPVNFSASATVPVKYTVTAENDETRTYAVTVRHAETTDDPEITGFYFTDPLAAGVIHEDLNTITVTAPSGTSRGSLRPTVYFTGKSVNPGSGTAVNFTGPVDYTVTGMSGKTRSYKVTVNIVPSSAKDITGFKFPGVPNTETIIGATPDADGTCPVSVRVPAGTDLSNLAPEIEHTGVSINPAGGTALNFTNPLTYTVQAEDGSSKTYTVRVYAADNDAKLITSFIFEEVPLTGGGVIRVVASIDQTAHTIRAEVPHTADLVTNWTPTLTWIGKSVAGPSGGEKTANPFTDTARNFSSSQTYTVTAQDNGTLPYTVTVILQSAVTITFTGEKDMTVIAGNTFDQSTGVITVTVNAYDENTNSGGLRSPYEWFVDGVKQPVSPLDTVFNLSVGDGSLAPGRHEIMVSGMKGGLHYSGKLYFVVAGGGL